MVENILKFQIFERCRKISKIEKRELATLSKYLKTFEKLKNARN
jgi:hypothetical protein